MASESVVVVSIVLVIAATCIADEIREKVRKL
jgi:hypothetical protein